MWWGILTNQILDISVGGLCRWSMQVIYMDSLCGSLWVSVDGLCGSLWMVSVGLHGSLWVVSVGGLHRSPQVVSVGLIGCGGDINQSKSVPMMSLNVVGIINQSNFRCLHRSLQVFSIGLRWWWWGKLTNQNLYQ